MADAEKIRAVVEKIEENPQSWNQGVWLSPNMNFCGTTACLAGHALLLEHGGEFTGLNSQKRVTALTNLVHTKYHGHPDAGMQILDLSYTEAEMLFYWVGEVLPTDFEMPASLDELDHYKQTDEWFDLPVEETVENLKRTITLVTGVTFDTFDS